LGVGVIGSYTTVSSLSLQTLSLARDGQLRAAAAYVGLSLLTGLAAGALGWWLVRI
jgi:CrcB protein